jgi:LPS-assembly protein
MQGLLRLALVPGLAMLLLMSRAHAVDMGPGPILLVADRVTYDEAAQVVIAEGNVEITRGERRLFADEVRYDQRADIMEARGEVVLLEPTGEAVFADRVALTGDLRDGLIEELRGRLADDSRFAAAEGRRIGGNRTVMDRAVYSPCRLCPDSDRPPLWQLTAQRVIHDQAERSVTYRNAFLEMWGVPVLYTPYFSHPDPTVERKSGFLAPTFGSDSQLGFMLETPYYFALAPNYDLTVAPIFTTEQNAVLTGEYRHLLPYGRYNLGGSMTHAEGPQDDPDDIRQENAFRGHVFGDGLFQLNEDWQGGYDIEVASDDTYLERYDFGDENVLENRVFAERIWGRNYAAINGYGFQGLRFTDEQGLIPIALPLAELNWVSEPWRWNSRFTSDSSVLALTRTEGLDTRRVSTTGGWELPWLGAWGDQYELRLSMRGDAYQTEGDPITFEDDGENSEYRLFPRATLTWSWPLIGDSFGLTPLIEPVVMATWSPTGLNDPLIPNEDSQDFEFDDTNLFEPDRFPGLDRVEDGAHVAYGLRFGLYGAGQRLNGLFGQSYRFTGENVFGPNTGLDKDLSDYVGRVDLSPDDWLNVRYRFRLDRDTLSLERNELGAVLGPPRVRFDVNYLSLEDDPTADEPREREEVTAGLSLRFSPALALRAQTRQNLDLGEPVAHSVAVVYRNPCLLLVAGIERRYTEDRDAEGGTSVSVRVIFQNLGELSGETSLFGL